MTHAHAERRYVPGMGRHWLLPVYDPLTALIGIDRARRILLDGERFSHGERVLDIGCGTGKLAVLIASRSQVDIVALDPDPKALVRAERRAARARVRVRFDRGFADALPYADGSFDAVVSSLMFHHLDRPAKRAMLQEVVRVLRPGGRLRLLDFVRAESADRRRPLTATHAHGRLADNTASIALALMREAGLDEPRRTAERAVAGGLLRVACFSARRPENAVPD